LAELREYHGGKGTNMPSAKLTHGPRRSALVSISEPPVITSPATDIQLAKDVAVAIGMFVLVILVLVGIGV
jgi:hypothetical protein